MSKTKTFIIAALLLMTFTLMPGSDGPGSDLTKCLVGIEFLSNQESSKHQLLECPTHAFGDCNKGEAEILKRMGDRTNKSPVFIQMCVSEQNLSMNRFAKYSQLVGINPYVTPSFALDDGVEEVWTSHNNPFLYRVENLLSMRHRSELLARIDVLGDESTNFKKRKPLPAEITWMVLAALGSGYKGIIWVGVAEGDLEILKLTRKLESDFSRVKRDLFKSVPVKCQVFAEGNPVSVRESDDYVFIFVLNKEVYKYDHSVGLLESNVPMSGASGNDAFPENNSARVLVSLQWNKTDLMKEYVGSSGGRMEVLSLKGQTYQFKVSVEEGGAFIVLKKNHAK